MSKRFVDAHGDSWLSLLINIIILVVGVFVLWQCDSGDKRECELRGGTWVGGRTSWCAAPGTVIDLDEDPVRG